MNAALKAEELKNNPLAVEEDFEQFEPEEGYEAPDKMDLEKEPLRMKGKETLELKLTAHSEKIDDIFVNN